MGELRVAVSEGWAPGNAPREWLWSDGAGTRVEVTDLQTQRGRIVRLQSRRRSHDRPPRPPRRVIALKGDSYRLKDRDLGRVPSATTTED